MFELEKERERKEVSKMPRWIDSKYDICLIIFPWASLREEFTMGLVLRTSDMVFKIMADEAANGGMDENKLIFPSH